MTRRYLQTHCVNCGDALEHKATGRPRRFCSARCRVAHRRAMKRWADESITAILAGEPEPELPGHAVSIKCYETQEIQGGRYETPAAEERGQ